MLGALSLGADKYWSGSGTWTTGGAGQWSATSGSGYGTSTWQDGDSAIFEGTPGVVTVSGTISVDDILFTSANGYTISGGTLSFVAGGSITNSVDLTAHTITSAITGSPAVGVADSSHNPRVTSIAFVPTSGTVTLGDCVLPYEDGDAAGDKGYITMGGTTTGNSVRSVTYESSHRYGQLSKEGSGSWSVGNVRHGGLSIQDGNLFATGEVETVQHDLQFNGGVFHYMHPGSVKAGKIQLNNGSFDNSSGAAIPTPTYNVSQTWGGNWTFIGSAGTNSDLNLGTGNVTLTGDRTANVSNSLTTLIVGGVIDDGVNLYGITKAGAGTLTLTGNNTYNGATTVAEGTLSVTKPYFDDDAFLAVSNGATLNLNYTGTDDVFILVMGGTSVVAGTWGRVGHPTASFTTNAITGDGVINNLGGLAPPGIWYWDGPSVGGIGDGAVDGGAGTWSTANANWDGGVTARSVWSNTSNDFAYFRTASGLVDLQSDITLAGFQIDQVDGYTIGSNPETQVMAFGGTNKIIIVDGVSATIRAGITGEPDVYTPNGFREVVAFDPDSAPMALGDVTIGIGSSSNPELHLRGTTTGNSVRSFPSAHSYAFLTKDDSGTWTVGDMTVRELRLNAGKIIVNGTMNNHGGINWTGGTLGGTGIVNEVVTVPAGGTIAPGDPTGTMTVTNNGCTINGTFGVEVNGASHSALAVQSTLTISGATLDVNVSASPGGDVVIATCGALVGEFAVTNGMDYWEVVYDANSITLVPPASGTVLIIR